MTLAERLAALKARVVAHEPEFRAEAKEALASAEATKEPAPVSNEEAPKEGKSKKEQWKAEPLREHEITDVIANALQAGATGERINTWIWLWGLPQYHTLADALTADGFRWIKSKKAWAKGEITNFNPKYIPRKMKDIRKRYGSESLN